MKNLIFVLAIFAIFSCEDKDINSEKERQLRLLDDNRTLWNSHDIEHYRFNQNKSCYCYFEDQNTWNIEIKKEPDQFIRFNNELVDNLPDYALSVNQLFDQIEIELNRNPYPFSVKVEYNATFGFPEVFSVDIDEMIADEEYSYHNADFTLLNCDQELFTGKLVLKGICMNYVIEVVDGDIDQNLIEDKWINEMSNVEFNNVFALGSVCSFPQHIEEGDTFQFSINTGSTARNCAVCEAYSPTPNKSLQINVCN